jgi:hypothetical protein
MYQLTIRVDTNTENMLHDVRSYDGSDFEQHRPWCVTTCNLIDRYKSSVVTSRKTLNSAVFETPMAVLMKIIRGYCAIYTGKYRRTIVVSAFETSVTIHCFKTSNISDGELPLEYSLNIFAVS